MLPLLGSGILDHTLLMADAEHNKTNTKQKLHIETIAYDNIHDQPKFNKEPFSFADLVLPTRRFHFLQRAHILPRNVTRKHQSPSQKVHTLARASTFSPFDAKLRFLVIYSSYSVLIPPWHKILHLVCLASTLFLAAFGTCIVRMRWRR